MANVTTTTAIQFLPELWSGAIQDYAERRFSLRNQVMDFSSEVAGSGDTLNIPKVTEETTAEKQADTAVTYSANTDGVVSISLNVHHYEAKRIEDIVKVQESANLFGAYAQSMGYALAKKVENYLAVDVLQGATGNDVVLGTDNTFTSAELRTGLQKLLDAGFDYTDGETFLYCSPAIYMSAMAQDEFANANERGDVQNPNASGSLGMIYGCPVFVSTDWADTGATNEETATIFKKEAVYFAQQISPRVQSAYDIDNLATSVVADVLFGASLSHGSSSTSLGVVNFNQSAS